MTHLTLTSLLERDRPVLLDGATGTELLCRGVSTELPLWSAHALVDPHGLEVTQAIHADYARAGAEILVTNTFRTNYRTLERAGQSVLWRELNRRAVEAARSGAQAAGQGTVLVAGGLAPLEDCYRPDLAPDEETCYREHRRQVELLARLGVDLICAETFGSLREARGVLRAVRDTDVDLLLGLCPKPPGDLLSGEPLAAVVPELIDLGADSLAGILLNCATPEVMQSCYPALIELAGTTPHGLYPHVGEPDDTVGWRLPAEAQPRQFAESLLPWLDAGASLVGGCCGTRPAHIEALRQAIERRSQAIRG